MTQTIFLSTVTAEFRPLRRRLASLTQRTKKCQVRHQDDFFHRGVKTLQKLAEEVQESDLVVHVIGAQSGWCIPADQAETFLDDDKHRDFKKRNRYVARQARSGDLPATQWEAWLGLHFGKRLMRRALAIDEQSYGAEHPDVAIRLNNLAALLQATNRLAEAEPLIRRALVIAVDFKRRTGHEHPNSELYYQNYRDLLSEMNLSEDEIEQRLREVTP